MKMESLWLHTMNVQPCSYLLKRANLSCVLPRRTFSVVGTYGQLCYMELTETHTKEINTHNGLFKTNGYKHTLQASFFAREERGKGGSGRGDEGVRGREILVHFLCSQNEKIAETRT